MNIGIIAGNGFYDLPGFLRVDEIEVKTKYGDCSGKVTKYSYADKLIYFLPRHGSKQNVAPHEINYRANIDCMLQLNVDCIVAITASGGISSKLKPGDIMIPSNAIDFTWGRISSFSESPNVFHVDMTDPFCSHVRQGLISAAAMAEIKSHNTGVFACTNGPRLETSSEVKMYKALGADVVGMTLFPECSLAKERGICYASLNVITNYAAGISKSKLTTSEMLGVMQKTSVNIKKILEYFISGYTTDKCYFCEDAF